MIQDPRDTLRLRRSLKLLNCIVKELSGVRLLNGVKAMQQVWLYWPFFDWLFLTAYFRLWTNWEPLWATTMLLCPIRFQLGTSISTVWRLRAHITTFFCHIWCTSVWPDWTCGSGIRKHHHQKREQKIKHWWILVDSRVPNLAHYNLPNRLKNCFKASPLRSKN